MTLSRRPAPDVPGTPSSLAEATRAIYDELDAELDAIFAGVSELEAARPPAPGHWSAKELIAHLVATERVNLVDIPLQISGLATHSRDHFEEMRAAIAAVRESVGSEQ